MSSTKKKDVPFWKTGRTGGKSPNGSRLPHVELYADLLQDPAFAGLTGSAYKTYIGMMKERGQQSENFAFAFTEISTRELENTLKGKAVRYIVNDAGEGLCLFFEGWTDNTGSNHGDAIHISPVIDAAGKPQLVVQYVPEEERPEDSETSNNGVVGE